MGRTALLGSGAGPPPGLPDPRACPRGTRAASRVVAPNTHRPPSLTVCPPAPATGDGHPGRPHARRPTGACAPWGVPRPSLAAPQTLHRQWGWSDTGCVPTGAIPWSVGGGWEIAGDCSDGHAAHQETGYRPRVGGGHHGHARRGRRSQGHGAYLRETRVRTYGRPGAYLRETNFTLSLFSTNT